MSASSEDEDVKNAIALSLEASALPTDSTMTMAAQSSGILRPDRAAMERERLARMKKGKASVSPPISAKRVALSTGIEDEGVMLGTRTVTKPAFTRQSSSAPPLSGITFAIGRIFKTWAFGHPRADDIKLEEVLQKQDLKLAIFCSFIWNTEWLLRKINIPSTRVVCVMQAKDEMTKAQMQANTKDLGNLRLCFPSMEGLVNCMHSKLMLLAHPDYLRVVVPSGNLIPHDWGETGAMENVVFVIDLPRLPDGADTPNMTKFGQELIRFCKALGLEESLVQSLFQFDFSATKDFAFVHTFGGAHVEEDIRDSTGYMGLGRAVRDLGLATKQNIKLDFVTSSLGNINESFLSTLYHAAQGDPPLTAPTTKVWKKSNISALLKSKPSSSPTSSKPSETESSAPRSRFSLSNFTIYFPTHATVAASAAGTRGAGTICLSSKYYDSDTFPRSSLRDCKSTREGMVMHSKIMYVRHPAEGESNKDYAYIGSANLSESAWGKVVMDRKLKKEKLNCRNWECGVVVPVKRRNGEMAQPHEEKDNEVKATKEEVKGLVEVFKDVVPVPMEWPGKEYGGRKPWFVFD